MRAAIAKAANAGFGALGDAKESVTYRRTSNSYDTATGVNTVALDERTISAIFTSYSEIELSHSSGLQTHDVKMLVLASELGIAPSMQVDRVIRAGREFTVLNYKTDPMSILYTFQLRAA